MKPTCPSSRAIGTASSGALRCDSCLRVLLLERTGITLHPHQIENLHRAVHEACEHFDYKHSEDYVEALRRGPKDSAEMEFLVKKVTVGETYFFRDPAQLKFLREAWLPRITRERTDLGRQSIRVWSAGCSSGEEVYTLAILLREALPDFKAWTLHVVGTDINTESLSKAVHGTYREWSFRATPDALRDKYFYRQLDTLAVRPDIRSMVKFNYLNLLEDTYPSILTETSALDLVLCRNVFIYFDEHSVAKVMAKFARALVPGGVLILGACDPVGHGTPALVHEIHDNVSFFRKSADETTPMRATKTIDVPLLPASVIPEPREPSGGRAVVSEQSGEEPDPMARVEGLLRTERWAAALAAADEAITLEGESSALLRHKTSALASLGRLSEASELCERSVALDPLDKSSHFLMGLILLELSRVQEAEVALRRAIYLDPTFLEAHFQLGLLRLRGGNQKAGLKSLQSAMNLAALADPTKEVASAPGMTYGDLTRTLANEIELYASE